MELRDPDDIQKEIDKVESERVLLVKDDPNSFLVGMKDLHLGLLYREKKRAIHRWEMIEDNQRAIEMVLRRILAEVYRSISKLVLFFVVVYFLTLVIKHFVP